jgi:hypothetical protein
MQRGPPSRVEFVGEALRDLYQGNARVIAELFDRHRFHR